MRTRLSLTEGSVLKSLLLFAFPMMLGNFLQQLYNIIDMLIVGKFVGTTALAAIGSAYTLMVFLTSLVIGLCMGSGALFSASYGAGNPDELKTDLWLSFWFIASVAIIIEILVYCLLDPILILLQIPEDVYPLIHDYVKIIFSGIFFTFLYNFFAYGLRSIGNSKVPLYFLMAASLLNIILDLIAVAGLKKGVSGAAVATVLSQMISGIGIVIYVFLKEPALKTTRQHRVFDAKRMKKIIINDILTGMQQSVMNFGILMIQGLVNTFGTVIMAAFAATVKIDTLAYTPALEFGNAYSLFISQNYGAKRYDRIREGNKKAMTAAITFCVCISCFVCLTAKYLMLFFVVSSERTIIIEGIRYLHIEGSMYFGIGVLFLLYGYYRAVEMPHMSLVLTIISLGTRVLLSYTLAPNTSLGVSAIWMSIPIGWILADLTGLLYRKKIERKFKI